MITKENTTKYKQKDKDKDKAKYHGTNWQVSGKETGTAKKHTHNKTKSYTK